MEFPIPLFELKTLGDGKAVNKMKRKKDDSEVAS